MSNKQIAAIMIAAAPAKTEYVVGFDSLNLSGGALNIIYQDGTFEQVPLDDSMSYYVNNGTIGTATVSVKYMGFETAFPITIRKPKPVQISILTPPNKTDYMEGEKIDLTGLRLMAKYDNGAELELADIPPLDHTTKLGEAVVALPVDGLLVPILIHVTQNQAISLSIRNLPKKIVYIEKTECFDPNGGMLEKKLNNGRIELVPLMADMVTGFNNEVVGKQTLTASYGGRSCTFEVEIIPRKCSNLTLKSLPAKRIYTEGTKFELYGAVLTASSGSDSWEVPVKELRLKEEVARLGCLGMVICYQDKEVEIPVTVLEKAIVSISVAAMPKKLGYKESSEVLDLSGGMLELRYDNGTTETVDMSNAEVSGFDNAVVGEQTITVNYRGKTTSFTVDIIPKTLLGICISTQPNKTEYKEGETFDSTGMVVSGLYDTGAMKEIERYQIMPVRPLTRKDTAIVVTYIDKTAVVEIKVGDGKATQPQQVALAKARQFYPSTLTLKF